MSKHLRHPLGRAVLVLLGAYVLIEFGIAYLPPLFGIPSGPVPDTVLFQYLGTVVVGILIWVSDNETRWSEFKAPLHKVMVEPEKKRARIALAVIIPALVGLMTFNQVKPSMAAPATLRSIHPAPPGQIDFKGETMELAGLENPLRASGSMEEHYELGREIYVKNCMACHGDGLAGRGHYALGFNPGPASFQDVGTIAQLTESYVFWRVAKGGPGLPNEGAPWNSAMPSWEDFLTEEEIWSVIIFMYEQAGHEPRTWEEEGEH
jgi:mono/diheme cytochrome c family protein